MIQVMKQWLILIIINMWHYLESTFMSTHQRLKVMWKIVYVECPPTDGQRRDP